MSDSNIKCGIRSYLASYTLTFCRVVSSENPFLLAQFHLLVSVDEQERETTGEVMEVLVRNTTQ